MLKVINKLKLKIGFNHLKLNMMTIRIQCFYRKLKAKQILNNLKTQFALRFIYLIAK